MARHGSPPTLAGLAAGLSAPWISADTQEDR